MGEEGARAVGGHAHARGGGRWRRSGIPPRSAAAAPWLRVTRSTAWLVGKQQATGESLFWPTSRVGLDAVRRGPCSLLALRCNALRHCSAIMHSYLLGRACSGVGLSGVSRLLGLRASVCRDAAGITGKRPCRPEPDLCRWPAGYTWRRCRRGRGPGCHSCGWLQASLAASRLTAGAGTDSIQRLCGSRERIAAGRQTRVRRLAGSLLPRALSLHVALS